MLSQKVLFSFYSVREGLKWLFCSIELAPLKRQQTNYLVEFLTQVDAYFDFVLMGWGEGWQQTNFPFLLSVLFLNISLKHLELPKCHFKRNLFIFKFCQETLLRYDCGQLGGSNYKALWRSHFATFMTHTIQNLFPVA